MRKLIIGLAAFGALVGVLFGVGVLRIAQGPQLVAGTDYTGYVNVGPAGVHFAWGELAAGNQPPVQAATLAAYVTACTTRVENLHSVTAKGTRTTETLRKVTCGKSYQEWMARNVAYYTGARMAEHMYKIGTTSPSHYREWISETSVSKTGRVTHRNVYTSR